MAGPYMYPPRLGPPGLDDYAQAAMDTERRFGPSAPTGVGALSSQSGAQGPNPGITIDMPAGPVGRGPQGAGNPPPMPLPPFSGPGLPQGPGGPPMPPYLPPPGGPMPGGPMPGGPMPGGPPPGGPMPGGPMPGGPMPGGPMPGGQAGAPPGAPKQPGNEGLVGRVLDLINGSEKQRQMQALQQALQQGMAMGAQATAGRVPGAPQPQPMGTPSPEDHIRRLLMHSRLNAPQGGPGGGFVTPGGGPAYPGAAAPQGGQLRMRRGGYPFDYLASRPGLPVRREYSRGSYVVGDGQGDGRSDHIDAKLSPKEYVMDAETMALAGNGDPDAGAKKFDALRKNIRAHKGRALAAGKFSPDAKPLESYMGGDAYSPKRKRR